MNNLSNRAFAWLTGFLLLLLVIVFVLWRNWANIGAIGDWVLHIIELAAFVGVCILGYLIWHRHQMLQYRRRGEKQHLLQERKDKEHARRIEADRLELERERERTIQMRLTLEHEHLQRERERELQLKQWELERNYRHQQAIQKLGVGEVLVIREEDGSYTRLEGLPPAAAIGGRAVREQIAQHTTASAGGLVDGIMQAEDAKDEINIPIPEKPLFWDIADLITPERMPLCFVVDEDPESPTYGKTVPQFGKIDDLLSLAVIGKPGKGKTVLLIYYSVILSVCGAETHIFDPHGVMGELALLHGRPLPGMPPTARIYYYDRKETMMEAVKVLKDEIDDRDMLYRPHLEDGQLVSRKTKHPLLILADELTILADFDEQIRAEYKERNQGKPYSEREEAPSLMHLFRRTVLEARKWRMFFCGSSQSIDASVLPTKVTDALNSRIVFFNSDRKARLVGLEADVIKKMLPLIRRAGPGMTIYDCARWDRPKIGAIPNINVDDMLQFLGVNLDEIAQNWVIESQLAEAGNPGMPLNGPVERTEKQERDARDDIPSNVTELDFGIRQSAVAGFPKNGVNGPVEGVPVRPDVPQFVPQSDDKLLPAHRWDELVYWYGKVGNVRAALEKMGITNSRYVRHASFLLEQRGLKVKRA